MALFNKLLNYLPCNNNKMYEEKEEKQTLNRFFLCENCASLIQHRQIVEFHDAWIWYISFDCFSVFIAAIIPWQFGPFTKIPNQYHPLHDIEIDSQQLCIATTIIVIMIIIPAPCISSDNDGNVGDKVANNTNNNVESCVHKYVSLFSWSHTHIYHEYLAFRWFLRFRSVRSLFCF